MTYIVTFDAGTSSQAQAARARAQGHLVKHVFTRAANGMTVELTAAEASKLAAASHVRRVVADAPARATAEQVTPPWGLDRVDQPTGISGTYSFPTSAGAGVKIYVVDTGVHATHIELAGRVSGGADFVGDGRGTADCNGHGTHVAGTAAGRNHGIAKAATVVPVRVLDCTGSGSMSNIIAALDWILANNASAPAVVNMSLGGGAYDLLDSAVRRVVDAGIPVVVAAGNSNVDACTTSPARATAAVTVGATDSADTRASWSNFGSCLDLFAPGVSIKSSWYGTDTATNTISGTSMAAPHVAGVAALLKGGDVTATGQQVITKLLGQSTSGVVKTAGTSSPNLLLHNPPATAPETLSVILPDLPPAVRSSAYATQIYVAGGTAPYTFTITSGTLPSGLTLAAQSGVISGTPAATSVAGTFTVRVSDATGASVSRTLTLELVQAPLQFSAPGMLASVTGSLYKYVFSATGGVLPYTWSVTSGTPGPGLTLDPATGLLSGTPTTAGTYDFTVQMTDAIGQTRSGATQMVVSAPYTPLAVATPTGTTGTVGTLLTITNSASGGRAPYSWRFSDPLPPGVTLNASTGVIAGVPTAAGTWSGNLSVVDAGGSWATVPLTLTIGAGAKPGLFSKSSPANKATRQALMPTLTWTASTGATSYAVCIDRVDNGVCDTSWVPVGSSLSFKVAANLAGRTSYFWQVRATNYAGSADANSGLWWRFTTK